MLLENEVAVVCGAGGSSLEAIAAGIQDAAMLNHLATLEDVGNVAAFIASDKARTMTSTDINISCGAIVD